MKALFNAKFIIWLSYGVLATIIIISLWTYFINPENSFLKDFSLNLSVEIIGIFLTIFLINKVIEIKDENERKKLEQIAFKQLKIPLGKHFRLLFNIYKASVISKPNLDINSMEDLFSNDYYSELKYFDFSKPAPSIVSMTWSYYLSQECEEFKGALDRTIDKYSQFLESDVIDLLERMINSGFLTHILRVQRLMEIDSTLGFSRQYNSFQIAEFHSTHLDYLDFRKAYIQDFTKLIDIFNSVVPDDRQIKYSDRLWDNGVAPRIGSARIEANN